MAGKKKKRAVVKFVYSRKKHTIDIQKKLILMSISLLMFVFSLIVGFHLQVSEASSKQDQNVFAQLELLPITPTPAIDLRNLDKINDLLAPIASPSSSVSPTLTQAPSPTVDNGYCLYVPVFMYHHIEPYAQASAEGHASLTVDNGWFSQQMEYLTQNGYTSLSADQLVDSIKNHQAIPAKSFVVTIDDGYSDIYTYAYPILKQYHVIGNLMIPTGLLQNPGYMTWDELREMKGSGVVELYNHTWSHSPLGQDSADKIQFELQTSQDQFQQFVQMRPTIMAYPYGSYSDQAISLLKQDGFVAAFSTDPGNNECEGNIMRLPRVRIGNESMASYRY